MKALIIGFGSIGKRHFEILNTFPEIERVDLVTKQDLEHSQCFSLFMDVKDIESYDYFVIASETAHHYEQLKYLNAHVENKRILVEKPLYDKCYQDITLNNKVYTAYNLRFHPVLMHLKRLIKDDDVYYANIMCGQYLPSWRPERDYRESYSADITRGGGVLRDLSHELDYMIWLFGYVNELKSIHVKRSDLEINADDIFTAIGITTSKTVVNISMDYLSKEPIRRMVIHTQKHTIEVDVIKNCITMYDKQGEQSRVDLDSIDRNYTYAQMHESILNCEGDEVCSFEEGLKVVDIIDATNFKEL